MQNDPLQQLKDVHLPPDPSWWPPAVGWWLLAIALIGLLVWLIIKAWKAYTLRQPIRAARAALANLNAQASSPLQYATEANAILKRLLVHALGRQHYAPLSGPAWLSALDQESGSQDFSQGPGQALGEVRFARQADIDPDALHQSVSNLLSRLKVNP